MVVGRAVLAAGLAMAAFSFIGSAVAQPSPARPIRIVVPFDAGGAMDVVMRLIGKTVTESGGPQIVVENRTGGGGVIGVMAVREAAPDGHTLLEASSSTHVLNPHMTANFPYHPVKDFQPITMLVRVPTILAVPGGAGVNSVEDLRALAHRRSGGLNYGSAGLGSVPHLTGALMAKSFGMPMTHVPYRGLASATSDLVAGRLDFVFGSIPSFRGQVEEGRVRLLAVAGAKRMPSLPDIPSMAELGYPTVDLDLWFGLLAPAGLEAATVASLNAMFVKAVNAPDLQVRFADMGVEIAVGSPADFARVIEADNARLGPLVREIMPKPP